MISGRSWVRLETFTCICPKLSLFRWSITIQDCIQAIITPHLCTPLLIWHCPVTEYFCKFVYEISNRMIRVKSYWVFKQDRSVNKMVHVLYHHLNYYNQACLECPNCHLSQTGSLLCHFYRLRLENWRYHTVRECLHMYDYVQTYPAAYMYRYWSTSRQHKRRCDCWFAKAIREGR